MKKFRIYIVLFFIILLFGTLTVSASATTKIATDDAEAYAGETVTVPVKISSNAGFVSASIIVEYDDSVLTLTGVNDKALISGAAHTTRFTSPYILAWENDIRTNNYTVNGTLAELVFTVSSFAEPGDYNIEVSTSTHGVLNSNGVEVDCSFSAGTISVLEEECSHDWSDWKKSSSTRHKRSCDLCGEVEYDSHEWDDGEVTEEATEDTTGVLTYTCDVCGATNTEIIPELPSEEVSVEGISLNKSSAVMTVGETLTLRANVTPSDASDRTVKWTSSDTTVASVTNGVVTGKKAGTATITVTTTDGNKTAKCTVTVNAAPVTDGIKLSMSEAFGATGQTITMDVLISDVPSNGISALDFSINYDPSQVELVEIPIDAGILGDSLFGNKYTNVPYRMTWNNLENYSPQGKLVTLKFKILSMPSSGEIEIELIPNECLDINEIIYDVTTTNGIISNSIPGDVTGDGKITQLDVTRLRKYLAGGWDVEIILEAADVTGDNKVTQLDVTRLRKYLAGGWDVTLE